MANTINGTINVKIQVQGGAITAAAGSGSLTGGTSGGGIGGVPKGWFSPTGVNPNTYNFERMMQQQQRNFVAFKQGQQKEESKENISYDKKISEMFKLYNKDMIEDLKIGYEQTKKQMLLNPMQYSAEEGEKNLKGNDQLRFLESQAKGIQHIEGDNKAVGNPAFKAISKFLPSLGVIGGALGLAGILQQSKLISAATSTFNDLMGALVDIILIPLIPILVPALKALAWFVGQFAAYIQDPLGQIEKKFFGLIDNLEKKFSFLDPIFNIVGKIVETIGRILSPILKILGLEDTIKGHINDFLKKLPSMGVPLAFGTEAVDVWKDIFKNNTITNTENSKTSSGGATRSFDNNTIIIQIPGLVGEGVLTSKEIGERIGKGLLDEIDRRSP